MKPGFAALGLELNQFVVESVSLPEDLQKVMDQRIGMNMAGDLGRLTQFETAESLEEAAQNTGGTAGMGVGLGAGAAMAQAIMGQAMPGQDALLGNGGASSAAAPTAERSSASSAASRCRSGRSSALSAGSSNELPILRSADAAWRPGDASLRCDYCNSVVFRRAGRRRACSIWTKLPELTCPLCAVPLWDATAGRCAHLHACKQCHGMLVPMGAFEALIEQDAR